MPDHRGGGDDITAEAFADYVHDIANQLAKAARTFDMDALESALHAACEVAVMERNRLTRMDGAS